MEFYYLCKRKYKLTAIIEIIAHIMAKRNNIPPALKPVHPGEILREELKERKLTQKAFAEQIGTRPSHLNELIKGKTSMTIAFADKLQEALGIDSQSWINLQTQYNYDLKALEETEPQNSQKATTLEVTIEDTSHLADIKRAISMIRGVGHVAVISKK